MVLKPSELSPLSALIVAEIMHDAGVPKGVFNLVNGDGPTVGQRIAAHPLVDMVSFTGSTRAGVLVAKAAADTVKRVAQELGGKSPNILLPDVDFQRAVPPGVARCFGNAGQSCSAATRMLVPADRYNEVAVIAVKAAETCRVGPPEAEDTVKGPLISQARFDKVQRLIAAGIAEGAELLTGGPGRPEGQVTGRPGADTGAERPRQAFRRVYVDCICHDTDALILAAAIHGEEHVLFGSDWPFSMGLGEPHAQLADTAPDLRQKIFSANPVRLLSQYRLPG